VNVHPALSALVANVETEFSGNREAIELALVALLSGGHLLIEDIPGIGKTSLALALAASLELSFRRIQFTNDLFPADILGITVFDRDRREYEVHEGPIFANVVLADEINRATPKTQSALLEAMQERRVTLDLETRELPKPFFVIATQNPVEFAGTFPLPEAQLDRFLLSLSLGYPSLEAERELVLRKRDPYRAVNLAPVVQAATFAELCRQSAAVHVEPKVADYLLALCRRTRDHEELALGVSVRGTLSLFRACQSLAFLRGRDFALPEDVKALAAPVLAHRLVLRREGAARSTTAQARDLIARLLHTLPVPR